MIQSTEWRPGQAPLAWYHVTPNASDEYARAWVQRVEVNGTASAWRWSEPHLARPTADLLHEWPPDD